MLSKTSKPCFPSSIPKSDCLMKSNYTKSQIEDILRKNDFEYHRVELPYGFFTPGEDRSGTRDIIFPQSLEGASVLDVGCANGYFCFEAEARGAGRVVGVELRESRFNHAQILKSIRSSSVDFLNMDITTHPFTESFDYVLLLNVIHHLPDPIHVLRYLTTITRKRLIVEFPTFSDPKYKKAAGIRFSFLYNRFPLIGVSSLSDKWTDQTFVFSSSALEKILMDHEPLFSRVNFVDSPLGTGRKVAFFDKL